MIIKDYDLNIFQPDNFASTDPWFLDVYEVVNKEHVDKTVCATIQLSTGEANKLKLGDPTSYFSDYDNWYGLDGFIKDYENCISPRLWALFDSLPKD